MVEAGSADAREGGRCLRPLIHGPEESGASDGLAEHERLALSEEQRHELDARFRLQCH